MSSHERIGPVVLSTGSFMPENIIEQELVEEMLGLRQGLGERLTGVKERRSFRNLQTLQFETNFLYPEVQMACFAGQKALSEGGVNPDEITDLVVGFEVTSKIPGYFYLELINSLPADLDEKDVPKIPPNFMPPPGLLLARMLGLKNAMVREVYGGCAELLNALDLAPRSDRKVLVVGSSTPSINLPFEKTNDMDILTSTFLFGDGAGAAVLDYGKVNLDACYAHMVDTAKNPIIGPSFRDRKTGKLTEFGQAMLSDKEHKASWHELIEINHRLILGEGPKALTEITGQVLKKSGLKVDDIARFLIHQASGPTVNAAIKLLKGEFSIPAEKIPTNYERYGNTGLASTWILLDEEIRHGRIPAGGRIVMAGIGPGFRANALLLEAT